MRAVRDWFDQTRREGRELGAAWITVVLVCVAFQALMVARLIFDASPADGVAYEIVQASAGAVAVAIGVLIPAAVLLVSPHRPVLAFALIGVAYLAASSIRMHDFVAIPLMLALYRVVADAGFVSVVSTLAASVAGMFVSSWLVTDVGFANEFVGQLSIDALSALAGVGVRSVRGWRAAIRQSRADADRARAIARERDQAMARTSIAAELHDSVGHNLTAIIALSQGMSGITDDEELNESLVQTETLAREGLAETKRAVRVLGRLENPTTPAPGENRRHDWAEIVQVTDRVRSLGVPVTVTETGERPGDADVADLGFTIVREALTNAVRHTDRLEHVSVAIGHEPGASRITIRSRGIPRDSGDASLGTGLERLSRQVTEEGGAFTAGPGESGEWVVDATLRVNQQERSLHA